MKPPYVAFSLRDNILVATTVSGLPPERSGRPLELNVLALSSLNEKGFDEAGKLVGGYVLGMLSFWYPEMMKDQYPNLFMDIGHQMGTSKG